MPEPYFRPAKVTAPGHLPRPVMPRFTVRRHKEIDNGLQWRTGVVLRSEHGARAVISADYEDRMMRVEVTGPLKHKFLTNIRDTLSQINRGFQRNRIIEEIGCCCRVCTAHTDPYYHEFQLLVKLVGKKIPHALCGRAVEHIEVETLMDGALGQGGLAEVLSIVRELKDMKPEQRQHKMDGLISNGSNLASMVESIWNIFG